MLRLKTIGYAVAAALTVSAPLQAQTFPSKPIRIVIPFAPGGSADTIGRTIADGLTKSFGQQAFAENRPGAGGASASAAVARAAPDGHTLVVSGVASHVIAPVLNESVKMDPVNDFTHLAVVGGPPAVLLVHPSLGVNSLTELVEHAKSAARKPPFASPGIGTQAHLVAEAFIQEAEIAMEHIPYKGGADTIPDLLSGRVQIGSLAFNTAAPHVKAGTLKALAITTPTRVAGFPDVPTFKELGYEKLVASTWFGLAGPPGLPPDVAQRLHAEVTRIFNQPEVRGRLEEEMMQIELPPLAEVLPFIKREAEIWGPLAKTAAAQQKP
jgi:tripartite-type tricarboxylate transporter receptor subunit TctC